MFNRGKETKSLAIRMEVGTVDELHSRVRSISDNCNGLLVFDDGSRQETKVKNNGVYELLIRYALSKIEHLTPKNQLRFLRSQSESYEKKLNATLKCGKEYRR